MELPGLTSTSFSTPAAFQEFVEKIMQRYRKKESHLIIEVSLQQEDKLHSDA